MYCTNACQDGGSISGAWAARQPHGSLPIEVGGTAVVKGLVKAAEHNGKTVQVLRLHKASGRYVIDIDNKQMKVKPENLHKHMEPLPGTGKEAARTNSELVLSEVEVAYLLKAEATKARVLEEIQKANTVAHIGTHATESELYFAGSSAMDAILSLPEIYDLQLDLKLAVLSACNTMKGELRSDGVIGVARAFLAAGADSVVAALWKVDDDATITFMKHLFESYLGAEAGGDAALAMQHKTLT